MSNASDLDHAAEQPSEEELDEWARATEEIMSDCANSQPWEGGTIWMNGHGPLRDALGIADVPEEHFEEVADRVRCPYCGNRYELYEEVGIKAEAEMRFERLRYQWLEDHQYRLDEFYAHLESYPYLGLLHEVGREINASLKQLPQREISGEVWYRARRIKDGHQLTADEFRTPNPEKVVIAEGRFNLFGRPVVYMAETAESAAAEVLKEGESRAWVMGFRLKGVGPILNLSIREDWADEEVTVLAVGLGYFGNLSRPVIREKGWKPQYLLPRFIADCARLHGFVGLVFQSSRYWADNLVLFTWDDQNIVPEGEPRIIETRPWKHPKGYRDSLGFWIPDSPDEAVEPPGPPVF